MKRLTLIRDYKEEATLGDLISEDGNKICKILERPRFYDNKENLRDDELTKDINESCCIPESLYNVIWSYSNKFKRHTFEILNVYGRDGVRIHRANEVHQLLGCPATVTKILDMNPKHDKHIPDSKRWFGTQSELAENRLAEHLAGHKQWELLITSNDSLCNV